MNNDSSAKRIQGLDELRGIAIITVLIAHFFHIRTSHPILEDFHLGGVGVDLFFVISGYLIVSILQRTRGQDSFLRTFYVRRIFRIIPLFTVVFLAGLTIAFATKSSFSGVPFYLTFTQNLLAETPPYGDLFGEHYETLPGLAPLWSLAVEEHVYILLPLLTIALAPRQFANLLVAIAVVGISCKLAVISQHQQGSHWLTYSNPHETWFRMQYLAFGGLLSMHNSLWRLLVIFFFWGVANFAYGTAWLEWIVGLGLILSVRQCIVGTPLIRNRWLARIGVLCYGIYLLHLFILIALDRTSLSMALKLPIFVTATFLVAYISFHYFETPVQKLRIHFESPKRTSSS